MNDDNGPISAVYILHFSRPISPLHTAQHYTGGTTDLKQRLKAHKRGKGSGNGGARLTQVAKERGINWDLAWYQETNDPYALEKKIKARKNAPKLCPICNPKRSN